jgi:enhancing lycopene biosynthesis protein 2
VESARIARGPVSGLTDLNAADFDAVVLPGGFGAAKNLSSFAVDGADCTVHPEVEGFLKAAHAAGRTIGAMCIAPAVIARVFGADLKPTVTIGTDPATAAAINATGAVHQDTPVDGVVIDGKNRIVSTPAYMMAGCISEVFDGASKFIAAVLETC